jgi:aminoglycoside 6-adenylyltransferase
MKRDLLEMLEWRALATRHDGPHDVWHIGTHMQTWVDAATWRDLHTIFGGFDRAGAWKALVATIRLFRKVAREAAERAGLDYPDELDRRVGAYVLSFADRLDRPDVGSSS